MELLHSDGLLMVLVAGSFLIFFPVGQVLASATRGRRPLRYFTLKLVLASIVCSWLIGSTAAAGTVYAWLQNRSPEEETKIVYLACDILESTQEIDVTVAIYNSSSKPLVLGPDSLTVEFGWRTISKGIPYSLADVTVGIVDGAGGAAPLSIVNPKQSTWLRLASKEPRKVEKLLQAGPEGIKEAERNDRGYCTVRVAGSEGTFYGEVRVTERTTPGIAPDV
jgi:hypothetical protein